MTDDEKYPVYWKGEKVGDFSASEMESLVSRGTLGFMHIVRTPDGDILLRDFLSGKPVCLAESGAAEAVNFRGKKLNLRDRVFLYALCGASFLSLWIWLASLSLCFYIGSTRDKPAAILGGIAATLTFAMGYVFFHFVMPVLMR